MADDDFEYDEQPDPDNNPRDLRNQLKAAKAEAKDAQAMRLENERLRGELLFRDAGLSLNDRQKAALQATHDGQWTPEAVKQTATELGFIPAEAPPADDPSLQQLQQITQASAGMDAPPASRDAEIDAQIAAARNPEELLEIYRSSGRLIAP